MCQPVALTDWLAGQAVLSCHLHAAPRAPASDPARSNAQTSKAAAAHRHEPTPLLLTEPRTLGMVVLPLDLHSAFL